MSEDKFSKTEKNFNKENLVARCNMNLSQLKRYEARLC